MNNKTLYITVISIIINFSLLLFVFPSLFIIFINSFLGNGILLLFVVAIGFYDYRLAIAVASIFIILYQAYHLSKKKDSIKEGFSWSPQLIAQFNEYQKKFHPNLIYDINIIKEQATPEEVHYLFKNNKWPWTNETKKLYKKSLAENVFIKLDLGIGLDIAQSIYNETAIKELLSLNTKEGVFLLNGVTIGHTKGLPKNLNNIVRCSSGENPFMEKTVNIGYENIYGNLIKRKTKIHNNDLPNVVTGFKFLNSPCNPCVALNQDYSCPFSIDVGAGPQVSSVWNNLWGLTPFIKKKSSMEYVLPIHVRNDLKNTTPTNEFPILHDLKKELHQITKEKRKKHK
jgi:hypothetical protein